MVPDDKFWAIDRFRSSDALLPFNGVSTVVIDASTVDLIFSSDVNEGHGVILIALGLGVRERMGRSAARAWSYQPHNTPSHM